MESIIANAVHREPWNKGKIVGQKAPFKLKDIWALRVRLQMESRVRELALLNRGIDSKLRGCDLVSLKVRDICHGRGPESVRENSLQNFSDPRPHESLPRLAPKAPPTSDSTPDRVE